VHKTVVVSDQYKGRGIVMKGLKVRDGETIPAWGVIAEYTSAIVDKKDLNEDSLYIFEVPKSICIDAEKEGNAMRFINHACKNPNACFICVCTEGQDTVYVRAIKKSKVVNLFQLTTDEISSAVHACVMTAGIARK
jgi:hypothetical protein